MESSLKMQLTLIQLFFISSATNCELAKNRDEIFLLRSEL